MAISLAWSSIATAINGGSVVCVIPPSSVAQDDVIVAFGGKSGRAAGGVGPPTNYSFTSIYTTGAVGTGPNFWAGSKIVGATPDSSILFQGSGNASDGTAYGLYIFRGVSSVIYDTTPQSSFYAGTNPNAPSVITATNNAWVLALQGKQFATTTNIFSILGWANQLSAAGNDTLDMLTLGATSIVATAGSVDPPATTGLGTITSVISLTVALTPAAAPTVTTSVISQITQTTATGGGNVTADGGARILERGVVWNTSTNPTTANSKANTAGTTGFFQSSLVSLSASTHYYARAFAINSQGSVYGANEEFDTLTGGGQTNFQFNGTGNPHKINTYPY